MQGKFTGKQAVQAVGCVLFCLYVCIMAFWNRTLVLEPVSLFLQSKFSFQEMKNTVQENYLGDRLRGKNDLISLNGGYARLQGRSRYNEIVRMTNGMLTDIATNMMDTSDFAENLSRFSEDLNAKGIPFLFVMTPYKIPKEENLIPTGLEDFTNAIADQALAELVDRNVPFLDLREDMSMTREQVEKYFYRTDHHWNMDGCFVAYQRIMEAIQAQFPEIKMTFTNPALWEKTVLPRWWLGADGRRVGPLFAGVDDLDYILPTFETEMSRYSLGVWNIKGDFRTACIREWMLEQSDYFDMDSYDRYLGGGYTLTLHRYPQAENPLKLMILRDSFMVPLECLLSTELTAIDVIDPRMYDATSEADYVTLNSPDMVILMICPGIFPSTYYKYYTNFGKVPALEVIEENQWDELIVSGTPENWDYTVLPARLESGKSYVLTLDRIQINRGNPDGAQLMLYHGDELLDQTVFNIDYGNQFEYRWGFLIPKGEADGTDFELRFYAGVGGATEGTELIYQGIRLQKCNLLKP